jgi:hypothetical protein
MLPDFVGIGVPRGGSTWLHELLAAHPRIYVPQRRKEIGYFHRFYERGPEWYAGFFPPDAERSQYQAVGEITPGYLYSEDAARRIAAMPSVKRLLLIVRHPVDRLYSQYVWRMRHDGYRESFEQFLRDYPDAEAKSRYAQHLQMYLRHFDRAQILVLIMEEAVRDAGRAVQQVCEFLGVESELMPASAGIERVNASSVPRFGGAFKAASRLRAKLVRWDLDFIVRGAKALGLKRLLVGRSSARPQPLDPEVRRRLTERFAEDIGRLEELLGRPISIWNDSGGNRGEAQLALAGAGADGATHTP